MVDSSCARSLERRQAFVAAINEKATTGAAVGFDCDRDGSSDF